MRSIFSLQVCNALVIWAVCILLTTVTCNEYKSKPKGSNDLPHNNHNQDDKFQYDDPDVKFEFEEHRMDSKYAFGPDLDTSTQKRWDNSAVFVPREDQIYAHQLVDKPVYISMASISTRIAGLGRIVKSHFDPTVLPTRLFVFISREPKFLDKGVTEEAFANLTKVLRGYPVSIVFTDQIGPHRKLVPLLWKKWKEDCLIVTMDDDSREQEGKHRLFQLIKYHMATGGAAISALRSKRIGFCSEEPHKIRHYMSWPLQMHNIGSMELMLLPTGTGGVLYRPQYFNPIVFNKKLQDATEIADDIMFRFCTLINNVPVVASCRHEGRRICPSKFKVFNNTYRSTFQDSNLIDTDKYDVSWNNDKVEREKVRRSLIPEKYAKQSTLYGINKYYNDEQIKNAMIFLGSVNLLNLQELADHVIFGSKKVREREESCYPRLRPPSEANGISSEVKHPKIPGYCAIDRCMKSATNTTPSPSAKTNASPEAA